MSRPHPLTTPSPPTTVRVHLAAKRRGHPHPGAPRAVSFAVRYQVRAVGRQPVPDPLRSGQRTHYGQNVTDNPFAKLKFEGGTPGSRYQYENFQVDPAVICPVGCGGLPTSRK